MWRVRKAAIAAALAVWPSSGAFAAPVSFPGAVGFGAGATGGRTGSVYHVTNLADSGTGSFRDAVSQSNRIIVFDVGGAINLLTAVTGQSNLTILGQTAPGDGIGLTGAEVSFYGRSNDIVRYVRFRDGTTDPGYKGTSSTSSSSSNCVNLGNTNTMIFDHVSAEFAAYNNIDAAGTTGANELTFQNSIIANPIASQRFNFHWEGNEGTFINNIFANSHNRSILSKGNVQFVNNSIYNYQAAFTTGNSSGKFSFDVLNNYFVAGPSTTSTGNDFYQVDNNQKAYASGNLLDGNKDGALNGSADNSVDAAVVLASPWSAATALLPLQSAAAAYSYNLTHAGASLHYDQVDQQVIANVQSLGTSGSLWNSETATGLGNGGFGVINDGPHITDSDNDGLPDSWETAHGLNPANANDYKLLNPVGYTMLEQYANELAAAGISLRVWNSNGGEWNTAGKWSSATPGIYDNASVEGAGGGTDGLVTITSTTPSSFDLFIGANGGAAGEKVVVSGGTLSVLDTITVGNTNTGTLEIDSGTVKAANVIIGNTVSGTTYTGSLALNGGVLQTSNIVLGGGTPGNWNTGGSISWAGGTVQASGTLSITAPATLSGAGAFVDTNGNSGAISGVLSGGAAFTKLGAGVLALSAANTYTGATNLNAGELGISTDANIGGAASTINFNGGILQVNGTAIANLNSHTFNSATFNGGFDIVASNNTFTVSQVLGGSGSLQKSGAGTLVLTGTNSFTGGVTLAGGVVSVTDDANLGANGNQLTMTGGTLRIVGTNLSNLANHPISGGNINGGIDVSTAGNNFAINQQLNGAGSLTKLGPGTLVLGVKNYYTGQTYLHGGTLRIADPLALRFTTLNLDTAGTTLDLNGINATIGGLTGNQGLDLKGLSIFVGQNNAATTYSGVLSDSVGTGVFTKIGTGTLTFTGTNTYTGATTFGGGTLSVAKLVNGGIASPLGAANNNAANLVFDGGSLQYTGAGDSTDKLFTLTAKGGTLDGSGSNGIAFSNTGPIGFSGTGNRTLTLIGTETHNNFAPALGDPATGVTSVTMNGTGRWLWTSKLSTYSGDTTVLAGTLRLFSGGAIPFGVGKGNVVVDSAGTFVMDQSTNINALNNGPSGGGTANGIGTFTIGNADASGTFGGALTGTMNLTKTGGGLQTLTGTVNTYSGGTTINGGAIQFAAAGSIGGTGATVLVNSGGGVAYTPGVTNTTFLGRISTASTGALALTTVDAATALNFTTTPLSPLAAMAVGAVGNVTYTGTYTPAGGIYRLGGGGGTLTYSPAIAGTSSVIVGNVGATGTVILGNAASSYTGTTTVKGGVALQVGAIANGGAASPIGASTSAAGNLVFDGGTFRYSGANATTDRLFTLTPNGGTIEDAAGDFGFTGVGPAAFTGTGSRTLTLSGANAQNHNGIAAQLGDPSGGSLSVVKNGTGRWFLNGSANTYSGDTTINAGAVYAGVANAIPSGAGKGNLNVVAGTFEMFGHDQGANGLNGAGSLDNNTGVNTITVGNGNAAGSFSGIISGGINLSKAGSGTQTLSGANTYTGTTTLSAGTLIAANSSGSATGSGAVTLNGGTLASAAGGGLISGNVLAGSGAHVIAPGGVGGIGTFTLGGLTTNANTTLNFDLNGFNGGDLLTLNSSLNVGAGSHITFNANPSVNGDFRLIGGAFGSPALGNFSLPAASGAHVYSLSTTVDPGFIDLVVSNSVTITTQWASSSGSTWNNAGNWTGPIPDGAGVAAIFATSPGLTASGTVTLDGNHTVGTITFNNSASYSIAQGTGGTLTIDNSGGAAAAGVSVVSGNHSISAPINATAGGVTFNTATGTQLTMSGAISGVGGLVNTGSGLVVLSSANTFSGNTLISGGTLQIADALALQNSTLDTGTTSGAVVDLNGLNATLGGLQGSQNLDLKGGSVSVGNNNANTTFSGGIVDSVGTGSLVKIGAGTLSLAGNGSYNGTTTVSGGTLQENIAGAIPGASAITLAGGTLSFNYTNLANNPANAIALNVDSAIAVTSGNQTNFAGVLNGNGHTLSKTGAGTLYLGTAASSVSNVAAINVLAGSLGSDGNANGWGGAGVVVNVSDGASVRINNNTTMANPIFLNGSVTGNGGLLKEGGTAGGGFSGTITLNTDSGIGGASNFTVSGNITGPGGLVKLGASTITLSSTSSDYAGLTSINAGTLQLGANNAMPAGGDVTIAPGATLDLNGKNQSVDQLTGSGTVQTGSAGGNVLSAGSANSSSTFGGTIIGAGGLTQNGAGTLALAGANTYTGITTINAGTIQISGGNNRLPTTTDIVIAAGAALDLNNLSQTIDTLSGSGSVSMGTSAGAVFTIGNANGTAEFDGIISGAGSLTKVGTGAQTLAAQSVYGGATNINAGTLGILDDDRLPTTTNLTIASAGVLALNDQNQTVAQLSGAGTVSTGNIGGNVISAGNNDVSSTFGGVISGPGGLTKIGIGTLTVSSTASTFTGPTTVSGGKILLSALPNSGVAGPLGAPTSAASNLVLDGGTLQFITTAASANTDRLFSLTSKGGTLDSSSAGTSLAFNFQGTGLIGVPSNANTTLTLAGTSGAHNTLNVSIADAGNGFVTSITKTGTGKWGLDSGNTKTYSGDTHIMQGTLETLISNGLSPNSNVVIDSGATLDFHDNSNVINALIGSGFVTNNFASHTRTFTIGANNGSGTFTGTITSGATLNLLKNGVGTQVLTGANNYVGTTTAGGGVLTIDYGGSITSSSVFTTAGGTININGSVPTTVALSSSGIANFGAGTGSTIFNRTVGSISVGAGGVVTLGAPSSHAARTVLVTGGLTIAGGTDAWTGKLDLKANDIIVQGGDPVAITNQLKNGFNQGNNGFWNGAVGIVSSAAAADATHLTTLGVIQNNDGAGHAIYGSGTTSGLFDNQNPTVNDVLVKYTYFGDADLSGKVDGTDYSKIDNGFNNHLTGWFNGDFNYDGVIDGSDYSLIDNAFNTQGAALGDTASAASAQLVASATAEIAGGSATTSVPEPGSIGMVGLVALAMTRRRRTTS